MEKYEYKTIKLKQKSWGLISSRSIPDLEKELNEQAKEGWRYVEHILPSAAFGDSDAIVLVFERKKMYG